MCSSDLKRNNDRPIGELTTLDISSKLTFEEIDNLREIEKFVEKLRISEEQKEKLKEKVRRVFPRVTLVVSAYMEKEVIARVMKTIVTSGYPGTYAIVASEAKDIDTIPKIKEYLEKNPHMADLISLSFTTTRPNNAATKFNKFLSLFFKRRIPQIPQTKPDADNQANADLVRQGKQDKYKRVYTFNLIDVEDEPQSRYLWEQTMGMMMTEVTLERLGERLENGDGEPEEGAPVGEAEEGAGEEEVS